jgi:hypothetical protein
MIHHQGQTTAMTRREMLLLGLGAALSGCATLPGRGERSGKRLIEFGWDEPDPTFMRRYLSQLEASPFDGCVFHVPYVGPDGRPGDFLWETWGRRAFREAELAPALADLRSIPFRRFTHNFLRFSVVPGDVDWFDDFSTILTNARQAARLAREGGAVGVLFDTEQYNAPLFDYRRQRDAGRRSWTAYAEQARRRGVAVMEGFQEGYPDLVLFLTFAYSLVWRESREGVRPLAACEYGLLAPFLDGMLEAARGGTRLVDGCELAYFHDKEREFFARAARTIRQGVLPIVADPGTYRRRVSVSFGLWMDYHPQGRSWDGTDGSRNYYTPAGFEMSVRAALEAADEYVWIYTQTPRWWSASGGPVDLAAGYAEGLRRARCGGRVHR